MKITIITPCYRVENLQHIFESIDFNYVDEWIIVYDKKKIPDSLNIYQHHPKIKE